ncbi:hypothetical protein G6F62_015569 [Rhizopus arrhizus]|nr:hypothetical protein G6F62_015569 [Rhizopus arrhizus]
MDLVSSTKGYHMSNSRLWARLAGARASCLRAAPRAARHPLLAAARVEIVVVLDRCRDRTEQLSAAWPVRCLRVEAGNVEIGIAHV